MEKKALKSELDTVLQGLEQKKKKYIKDSEFEKQEYYKCDEIQ